MHHLSAKADHWFRYLGNTVKFDIIEVDLILSDRSRCPLEQSSSTEGEGNGTPLQYFCLENPMDGGAW